MQRYKAGGVGMLGRGLKNAVGLTNERIGEFRIITSSTPYFEVLPSHHIHVAFLQFIIQCAERLKSVWYVRWLLVVTRKSFGLV